MVIDLPGTRTHTSFDRDYKALTTDTIFALARCLPSKASAIIA